jgi:hypothetical protein
MKQKKSGGPRPNAGAKKKYGEETKNVTFRIPISLISEIREVVYREIIRFMENKRLE